MVAPLALVVDGDAVLALAGRLDHRAVGIEDGHLEKVVLLLPPDLQPHLVEDFLQGIDVSRIESAAQVPDRARVRNPPGSQGVDLPPRRSAGTQGAQVSCRPPGPRMRCSGRD